MKTSLISQVLRARRLLLTLCTLAACSGSAPGTALQKYIKAVEAGDVTKAVAMYPMSAQSQFGSKLVAFITAESEGIKKRGGVKAMDVLKEDVTGDIATVTIATHYGNGTVDTVTTKMMREEHEWKINQ